jgi:folate-binding Fe-S cluster repair protein YgfZ
MTLAWIDRSGAGKLGVGGPDALAYLQALLSADLAGVAVGAGVSTALLTPKGQVRALARALRTERGWLLHCERPALEGLFRGLWSGRVGWRVELHKLTLAQGLVSVVGEADALRAVALDPPLDTDAPELTHRPAQLAGVPVRAMRAWAGLDLVARAEHVDVRAALGRAGAVRLDRPGWDALRIARGRIAYGEDALDTMLPAELALDAATVATEKGLYPGLQTVLRQQRSGTVQRRICRVHAEHVLLAPGDELLAAGAGDRPAGRVTSALAFDGLAVVRTGAQEPIVHGPTGTRVRVEPLERGAPSL